MQMWESVLVKFSGDHKTVMLRPIFPHKLAHVLQIDRRIYSRVRQEEVLGPQCEFFSLFHWRLDESELSNIIALIR